MLETIPARSGLSFRLSKGQKLRVRDPQGQQVSDLFCVNAHDQVEVLSTSRSMDEAESLHLTTGNVLVSNRSNPMLKVLCDSCGRHDLLMPPCREAENGHPGCFENLTQAFLPHGLSADHIAGAFNLFMHVVVTARGRVEIHPPLSNPGDEIVFEAQMDLIVGLTACAHLQTNAGVCKPIQCEILL